jgi:hypothetical protein
MMFQYSITHSDGATKALKEISDRLFQSTQNENENENDDDDEDEDQSSSSLPVLQLVSMKESFDIELLKKFYEELMITNFPLEDERDDIEDWIYCLDPTQQQNQNQKEQGPSMDVLLLILKQEQKILEEKDKSSLSKITETTTAIIGGIAFEYYKQAQCGLLSYIVVAEDFRRLGILRSLHPVACEAIQLLHEEEQEAVTSSSTSSTTTTTTTTVDNINSSTTIKAIFAETNTIEAGDVPPEIIRKRHEILYSLGYRQLKFPYVQPPLVEDGESFDDIMLLIYGTGGGDDNNNNNINPCDNERSNNNNCTIETEILYGYVVDFYKSVTGYDTDTYKNHWYYKLVDWYRKENYLTEIAKDLPWDDITQEIKDCMIKKTTTTTSSYNTYHLLTSNTKILENLTSDSTIATATVTTTTTTIPPQPSTEVVVVGAGIAGLVATITLAEEYLKEQQQQQQQQHPSQERAPLTITLIEANSFVGGRIRTVVSNTDTETKNDEDSTVYPLMFNNDRLSSIQKVDSFAPWPVAIGAEFIHGVDSMVNELIEKNEDWLVQETFDLCSSLDEYPSRNSFVQRRSSLLLTTERRNMPHVQICIGGRCYPLQHQYHQVNSTSTFSNEQNRVHQLIRQVNNIWNNLQDISEDTKTGVKSYRDMSLDKFIEEQLCHDEGNLSDDDIETVKQIIECLYSNTAGSSNMFMGVCEASREEYNWEYTESNFRSGQCFAEFIKYYLDRIAEINKQAESRNSNVKINIVTACPIVEIGSALNVQKEDNNKIRNYPIKLSASAGDTFDCDKCIVTVPLGVLKANKINFRDEYKIPTEMQDAIDTINMFSGIKAHMLLKIGIDISCMTKLMKSTELFFCPGEIFSQVWLRRNEETVFLTGFCVSNCRDRLIDLVLSSEKEGEESKSEIAQNLMLQQIQRLFEPSNSEEKAFVDPYSPTCSSFALHDWSEDEFTLGIYSSPSVGADFTHRDCLTKPINNDIWFAGEHATTTTCATVQSAMESGSKAAKEVFQALESDQK